jgi:hypothetical protein
MIKIGSCAAIGFALAMAFGASSAAAQERPRVEVGTLFCTLSPSVGALIGSRRRMTCRLSLFARDRAENYAGTITRFGVDVGATVGGVLSWRVLTRTRVTGPGMIAGNYVGISADASLGIGGGAKVLVGGSRRSTMLQPVSFVGNIGLNAAVGVTGMTLRFTGLAD